jgi:hypothetical protein
MNWEIDLEEDLADDAVDEAPAQATLGDDGWGDDEEALAALPDPEAEAAAKKKEEEEREAERQRLEASEKKRKQDKAAAAQAAKDAKKKVVLAEDEDEGGLFSVEAANLDSQYTDFKAAADLFGTTEQVDSSEIDIGRYVPNTIGEFEALKNAIVAKVETFPATLDRVKVVQLLMTALADDYNSSQLRDLTKHVAELQNARLGKKQKAAKGGSFLVVRPTGTGRDDDDDFM